MRKVSYVLGQSCPDGIGELVLTSQPHISFLILPTSSNPTKSSSFLPVSERNTRYSSFLSPYLLDLAYSYDSFFLFSSLSPSPLAGTHSGGDHLCSGDGQHLDMGGLLPVCGPVSAEAWHRADTGCGGLLVLR